MLLLWPSVLLRDYDIVSAHDSVSYGRKMSCIASAEPPSAMSSYVRSKLHRRR